MVCTLHPTLFYLLMAIQAAGILSMFFNRATEGTRLHGLSHGLFFAAFASVGFSAITALAWHSHCWIVAGITLGIMIVGATCDFNHTRQPVTHS